MRTEAMQRRAEVEELERQLAKLEMAKKDAESAEKLAQARRADGHLACVCIATKFGLSGSTSSKACVSC